MSLKRQVKRYVNKREMKEATVHLINVAKRHEQMLHAMDQYIEQLERLLVSKGILSQEEVEGAAERAISKTQEAVAALSAPKIESAVEQQAPNESNQCTSVCGSESCQTACSDEPKVEGSIEL